MKKIIFALGAVALLAAGCNTTAQQNTAITPANQQTQNQIETKPQTKVTNSQTYTNTKYNYSFQYPADYAVTESIQYETQEISPAYPDSDLALVIKNDGSVFSQTANILSVSAFPAEGKTLQDWFKGVEVDAVADAQSHTSSPFNVKLGGYDALEADGTGAGYTYSKAIGVQQGNSFLLLEVKRNDQGFDQVLSTFKFKK